MLNELNTKALPSYRYINQIYSHISQHNIAIKGKQRRCIWLFVHFAAQGNGYSFRFSPTNKLKIPQPIHFRMLFGKNFASRLFHSMYTSFTLESAEISRQTSTKNFMENQNILEWNSVSTVHFWAIFFILKYHWWFSKWFGILMRYFFFRNCCFCFQFCLLFLVNTWNCHEPMTLASNSRLRMHWTNSTNTE